MPSAVGREASHSGWRFFGGTRASGLSGGPCSRLLGKGPLKDARKCLSNGSRARLNQSQNIFMVCLWSALRKAQHRTTASCAVVCPGLIPGWLRTHCLAQSLSQSCLCLSPAGMPKPSRVKNSCSTYQCLILTTIKSANFCPSALRRIPGISFNVIFMSCEIPPRFSLHLSSPAQLGLSFIFILFLQITH